MADWDVIGTAPAQVQNPWAVRKLAPAPETIGGAVKKAADFVGSNTPGVPALENIVSGITGGLGSLVDALTFAQPGTHNFAYQPRTTAGKAMASDVGAVTNPVGGAVAKGIANTGLDTEDIGGSNQQALEEELKTRIPEALGAVGTVTGAGGLAKTGLASSAASAAETAASAPAAVTKYGLRTAENNPIARNVAGDSARPAVTAHNQSIADPTLGAQAGVPVGMPLNQTNLEAARAAPDSVYARAEKAIPTGPLSPQAAKMVQSVGADDLVVHSPDTQATVDAQKARLTSGDLTGPQVVNAQRALRFNGFRNVASEDPEQSTLGHAQLKMSDALHQHMLDTIPPGADVSPDQLNAARTALAQNHTVGNFLKGNNVDLQGLARLHRDSPNLLSGPLKDFAEFADLHPEVSSLPSNAERFNPSGVAKDAASVDLKNPSTYLQPFFGAAARRAMTGAKPAVQTPVTGLGGEFGPIDRTPQPPPGLTASPPTAPPPTPAGPPGQLSLADLLSHGVEQGPSPGLTAGPMGAPAPAGIPFTRNAAHEAGGLGLADEFGGGPFRGKPMDMSDFAGVKSQGVPEDIMQRTAASGARPKVAHSPAFINENASLDNPASMEGISARDQALAKGVQPVSFGADDAEHAMSPHDIQRRDLNPAPDSVFINKKDGTIINSGSMAPRQAQALLARWKAIHGGALGEAF